MTPMRRAVRVALVVSLVAFVPTASALTFTCEGIAAKGLLDPAGSTFAGKFGGARHGGPAINGQGDVVFFATPRGGPPRLYLYPGGGGGSIVAQAGDAAPGGGSFTRFQMPSINDADDIGFFGDLASGEGVFIRPGIGGMVAAALSGQASPGGGTFDSFPGVSRINAAGDIAFFALVNGGPSGIFRYDAATTTVTAVALVGDVALDGREICDFQAPAVGLGGARAAFQTTTKVSCADSGEPALIGIYRETGLGTARVALAGDATPVIGTTYSKFYGEPDSNATDQIVFRASASGSQAVTGIFLFDPAGPSTSVIAKKGDAAPGGGALQTIVHPSLTDGGRAGFRARLSASPAHEGIFLYDGTDEAVVRRSDPVPVGIFTSGSTYRKIFEEIGVDRSGTHVTYSANVKEGSGGTLLGLLRCSGS